MFTSTSLPCTSAAFAELSAEVLRDGKVLRFRGHGASMEPLVRDGDILWVEPVDARGVRCGDTVLFHDAQGRVVVHRVIGVDAGFTGRRFTLQGDAVLRPDGVIPQARIFGRLAAIERDGKRIEMDQPVMRVLGWLALLRSRWSLGRGRLGRLSGRLARQLPVLRRYLA